MVIGVASVCSDEAAVQRHGSGRRCFASRAALLLLLAQGCGDGGGGEGAANGDTSSGDGGTRIIVPKEPVAGVDEGCGDVRLTAYDATDTGWCEFDGSTPVLPAFVRERMTLAIAEPYNGSSYQGEAGEACGECWEIDTISATQIVMVNNLCPIEGNPLCAGGHFHFDLTQEAAAALGGGGLDAAQARRVPCPVSGNIHVQINDRNEWGYLRVAFINQRVPIRLAEYRAADAQEWTPVERSGGAWHVLEDDVTFAEAGPGGVFRFTSPTGESVEGSAVLRYEVTIGSVFDTGAQFQEAEPNGNQCTFVPPGDVYDEGWGGIDQVRWQCNPWGEATCSEISEGCAEGSATCVLVDNLAEWDGLHLYYRQSFPTATFSALRLKLRARGGGGEVLVSPSYEGTRCRETAVTVGEEWVDVRVDVTAGCTELSELNALTISNQSDTMDLLIDEIRYE